MPRPANSSLLSLFQYNNSNQLICNNGGCGGRVLFKHSTNLQRHLKVLHPSLFASYLEIKKVIESKNELNVQKTLIELVRARPILFSNENDSESHNTCLEWEQISRELDMDVETCKQKWNYLRLRFTKEFLKRQRKENEAADRRIPSDKNGKLLACLQFLRDEGIPEERSEHNESNEMSSKNSHIEEDSSNSCTLYNDDDLSTSRLMQNKIIIYDKESKQMSAEADEEDDDNCINEKQITATKFKPQQLVENDTEKMFLLSLVPYLKAIPESRRLNARHRIQGILLEEQQKQIQLHIPVKIENTSA